jgi:DNA-binding CsgD family transcriptional regulator/tetratricopeptide (TPR) repeat protein
LAHAAHRAGRAARSSAALLGQVEEGGGYPVGRVPQLAALDRLVADLAGGRGGVLWVEGEPGIGKSLLVDELVARLPPGTTVLRAAAGELTRPFPLQAMARALGVGGAADSAGRLDPVLAAGEQMLALIDRHCCGPVLLVLEDLQWADEASVTLWTRLTLAVDQLPLLLVGTRRPAPDGARLDQLRAAVEAAGGTVLALDPLTPDDVRTLAARLLGREPDRALLALLAEAGGNPSYVRELVVALPDRPASLTAAIHRRLATLEPGSQDVLRLAALLGREFAVQDLALATVRQAAELMPELEAAAAAGILDATDERLVFRHDVVREVLVDDTAPSLRAALHSQFAQALAESGAGLGAVAPHLLAGASTLQPWTARWLAGLPEAALYTAPEVAIELLERAVRAPGVVDRWTVLAARLATLYLVTGRDDDADGLAAEVLRADVDPDERGRMLLLRVRVSSRRTRTEVGLGEVAAALADERLPPVWAARIRARRAIMLFKLGRFREARTEAERALADATAVADAIGAGTGRLVLGQLAGDASALEHIDAGLFGLGADPEAMDLRLLLLNNRLAALNNLGRGAEFRTAVDQALILADQAGSARSGWLLGAAAMGLFDFGDWDGALLHLDSMQSPQPASVRMTRHGLAALIAGHREDWPRLREHVAVAAELPITAGDTRILSGYLVAARALRAQADGDLDRAVDELATWLDPDLGYDAGERYMWLPDLVRLALAAGRADVARAAAAASEADARSQDDGGPGPRPRQRLAAEFCRGQLTDDVAALKRVAATARRYGWVPLEASVTEEAAVRLAAARDVPRARAALGDAVRSYTQLGATWDVRRADARLRAHGVRRGPRSLHRRPDSGWSALTPTERRVADLVAAGRSNPDIAAELVISRRTVQTHVSHILRKLALTTRTDIHPIPAGHDA